VETSRMDQAFKGASGGGARPWGLAWTGVMLLWGLFWLKGGDDPHFFWSPWGWSAALKAAAVAVLAAGALWAAGRGVNGEKRVAWGLAALFVAVQAVWLKGAWSVLRSGTWGFDHPSFMFRVWEFGKVFPGALGGYLPQWNGGVEHFVGVTSGAHAFGLPLWPLLRIWEQPHVFYGAALAGWFIVAVPWVAVASLRGAGAGWCAALCAGFAVAGATQEFFLWMWHFGTVGAMTSAAMTVPAAALAWRVADGRGGWGSAVLLGVAAWMVCLWTPGAFALSGLGAGWLLDWRGWTRGKWAKLGAAAGLCALLWLPWLWTTLFPCRNVVEYVNTDLARPGFWTMVANGADSLWRRLPATNPVLLALGLGGLAAGAPRGMKRLLWPSIAILAALAGWSKQFKPLSQMDRMFIPLAMLLAVPASVLLDGLFRCAAGKDGAEGKAGRRWRIAACLACGAVLAALSLEARLVRAVFLNERAAKLRTCSGGRIGPWVDWLRENVPEDGRVAFAGKAVHAYGGGNTAYLPVLTGREMMGDDYYGFPRGTIAYDYPPRAYRERGEEGWRAFGEAYGVTHWVAVRNADMRRLAAMPDLCAEVARFRLLGGCDAAVFAVKGAKGGRFLEGSGRVEAEPNRLLVHSDGGRSVIRYNWRKGLVCKTPGASIGPFDVDGNLTFIAVEPGTNGTVEIGYRPHWSGIEPNFDGWFHH